MRPPRENKEATDPWVSTASKELAWTDFADIKSRWESQFGPDEKRDVDRAWVTSDEWIPLFLANLERHGVISRAGDAARVGRSTIASRMKANKQFRRAVNDARKRFKGSLEVELIRRSIEGDPIYATYMGNRGEQIGVKRSDDLLKMVVQRHFPAYRPLQQQTAADASAQNFGVALRELLKIDESGKPIEVAATLVPEQVSLPDLSTLKTSDADD